jgi:hypothetical protein
LTASCLSNLHFAAKKSFACMFSKAFPKLFGIAALSCSYDLAQYFKSYDGCFN